MPDNRTHDDIKRQLLERNQFWRPVNQAAWFSNIYSSICITDSEIRRRSLSELIDLIRSRRRAAQDSLAREWNVKIGGI